MNKKEAIEKLEQEATRTEFTEIDIEVAIKVIEELEEPEQEKIVIPQFVIDWITECKKMKVTLGESFDTHYEDNREIHSWFYNSNDKNSEIYAMAWITNEYTVEKEKLYQVKMPNGTFLIKSIADVDGYQHWFNKNVEMYGNVKFQFTEQEIKAIDERYWAFAEEVPD